jgi:hypothetical protein
MVMIAAPEQPYGINAVADSATFCKVSCSHVAVIRLISSMMACAATVAHYLQSSTAGDFRLSCKATRPTSVKVKTLPLAQ